MTGRRTKPYSCMMKSRLVATKSINGVGTRQMWTMTGSTVLWNRRGENLGPGGLLPGNIPHPLELQKSPLWNIGQKSVSSLVLSFAAVWIYTGIVYSRAHRYHRCLAKGDAIALQTALSHLLRMSHNQTNKKSKYSASNVCKITSL